MIKGGISPLHYIVVLHDSQFRNLLICLIVALYAALYFSLSLNQPYKLPSIFRLTLLFERFLHIYSMYVHTEILYDNSMYLTSHPPVMMRAFFPGCVKNGCGGSFFLVRPTGATFLLLACRSVSLSLETHRGAFTEDYTPFTSSNK